jgi:hypothetical protein
MKLFMVTIDIIIDIDNKPKILIGQTVGAWWLTSVKKNFQMKKLPQALINTIESNEESKNQEVDWVDWVPHKRVARAGRTTVASMQRRKGVESLVVLPGGRRGTGGVAASAWRAAGASGVEIPVARRRAGHGLAQSLSNSRNRGVAAACTCKRRPGGLWAVTAGLCAFRSRFLGQIYQEYVGFHGPRLGPRPGRP